MWVEKVVENTQLYSIGMVLMSGYYAKCHENDHFKLNKCTFKTYVPFEVDTNEKLEKTRKAMDIAKQYQIPFEWAGFEYEISNVEKRYNGFMFDLTIERLFINDNSVTKV